MAHNFDLERPTEPKDLPPEELARFTAIVIPAGQEAAKRMRAQSAPGVGHLSAGGRPDVTRAKVMSQREGDTPQYVPRATTYIPGMAVR